MYTTSMRPDFGETTLYRLEVKIASSLRVVADLGCRSCRKEAEPLFRVCREWQLPGCSALLLGKVTSLRIALQSSTGTISMDMKGRLFVHPVLLTSSFISIFNHKSSWGFITVRRLRGFFHRSPSCRREQWANSGLDNAEPEVEMRTLFSQQSERP